MARSAIKEQRIGWKTVEMESEIISSSMKRIEPARWNTFRLNVVALLSWSSQQRSQ